MRREKLRKSFKYLLLGALALGVVPGSASAQAEQFLQEAEEAASRGENLTALHLFQSAIIYAPRETEPYLGIAEFYAETDQADLAEKYFGMALGLEPANPPALRGLALLALAEGDVEGAEAHHRILVEACAPQCPEEDEVRRAITANESSAMAAD